MFKFSTLLFVIGMAVSSLAHADMGTWTGRQIQVSGVNGHYGWNCEYMLYGRAVWVTTTGVCPTAMDVR
jgi:hypothetical protein